MIAAIARHTPCFTDERFMETIEALMTRRQAPRLVEPGPTPEHLAAAFAAALGAPEHGKLRPWRFVVIEGAARLKFGEVLAEALKRKSPRASEEQFKAERERALRAPVVIVAAAKIVPHHPKIPEIEQVLSAACATQNFWLACHGLGYGCMWKTGAPAYDPAVKTALGLGAHDHIVAFMYVGTPAGQPAELARPDPAGFVSAWTG